MITQERLRELIDYNPITGMAFWRVNRRGGCKAGDRVGSIQYGSKRSKPYRYFKLKEMGPGRVPFTHIVHLYMTGRWPDAEMDHIHGNTLDDRWLELRPSTREQNEANRGARKNSRIGIKGVSPTRGGRFKAEIYRCGVHKYLGTFATPQEAQAAYLAEAAKHDGQFLRAA